MSRRRKFPFHFSLKEQHKHVAILSKEKRHALISHLEDIEPEALSFPLGIVKCVGDKGQTACVERSIIRPWEGVGPGEYCPWEIHFNFPPSMKAKEIGTWASTVSNWLKKRLPKDTELAYKTPNFKRVPPAPHSMESQGTMFDPDDPLAPDTTFFSRHQTYSPKHSGVFGGRGIDRGKRRRVPLDAWKAIRAEVKRQKDAVDPVAEAKRWYLSHPFVESDKWPVLSGSLFRRVARTASPANLP